MSHQALARKWRPKEFSALVGQDHVVRALGNALQSQRLHHAYLFTGTRGVGKTTIARLLAKSLNCVGPDGKGGITSRPCNVCGPCAAIDAGRFVDYIEMDAASNRGVEEMTQLLEQAAYAPTDARFKVYTIDEVHMLTSHAFNAMLKTLEEPPSYVKFILATTDPQKIPVTVLSRCLQFNLKQVPPALIAERLAQVFSHENIVAEPAALRELARAARGSMRDALSLADQAIVYSAGAPSQEAVQHMLGTLDLALLLQILDAVAQSDAKAVLSLADRIGERGLAYAQALRDLAGLLHRLAMAQAVPSLLDDDPDGAAIRDLATRLTREQVQLCYQIALHGRNDLSLAPDDYAGFTMTLLRMIGFMPELTAVPAARSAALQAGRSARLSVPVQANTTAVVPPVVKPERAPIPSRPALASSMAAAMPAVATTPSDPMGAARLPVDIDWPAVAAQLRLLGLARELAMRSELVRHEGNHFHFRVPVKTLLDAGGEARLRQALADHFGGEVRLTMEVGSVQGKTGAARREQARVDSLRQAHDALEADPVVRQFQSMFGAVIDARTVRPVSPVGDTVPPTESTRQNPS